MFYSSLSTVAVHDTHSNIAYLDAGGGTVRFNEANKRRGFRRRLQSTEIFAVIKMAATWPPGRISSLKRKMNGSEQMCSSDSKAQSLLVSSVATDLKCSSFKRLMFAVCVRAARPQK